MFLGDGGVDENRVHNFGVLGIGEDDSDQFLVAGNGVDLPFLVGTLDFPHLLLCF